MLWLPQTQSVLGMSPNTQVLWLPQTQSVLGISPNTQVLWLPQTQSVLGMSPNTQVHGYHRPSHGYHRPILRIGIPQANVNWCSSIVVITDISIAFTTDLVVVSHAGKGLLGFKLKNCVLCNCTIL